MAPSDISLIISILAVAVLVSSEISSAWNSLERKKRRFAKKMARQAGVTYEEWVDFCEAGRV